MFMASPATPSGNSGCGSPDSRDEIIPICQRQRNRTTSLRCEVFSGGAPEKIWERWLPKKSTFPNLTVDHWCFSLQNKWSGCCLQRREEIINPCGIGQC